MRRTDPFILTKMRHPFTQIAITILKTKQITHSVGSELLNYINTLLS